MKQTETLRCFTLVVFSIGLFMTATGSQPNPDHRPDNFSTVAYWYQQGSHKLRRPLPTVEARLPRLTNVAGPTVGKP